MAFKMIYGQRELTKDLIKVVDVFRTILPPKEVRTLSVPVRDGAYFTGQSYGARLIEVDILLHGKTEADYHSRSRLLAYFLDSESPQPLWFSDEPGLMYYAVLVENTNLDEILYIGKGTLRFLCPNPFAHACDVTLLEPDGDGEEVWELAPKMKGFDPTAYTGTSAPTDRLFAVQNLGTAVTYPRLTTRFQADSSFLSIVGPMGAVMIGQPEDTFSAAYKSVEKILADNMASMTGWVTAGTLTNTNSIVNTGTMTALTDTAGTSYMKASSFGTGTAWHGPAVRKTIPGNRTAEQFRFTMDFTMSSNREANSPDEKELGLMQVIGWSATGKQVFMLQVSDASKYYESNKVQLRLGDRTVYHPDIKLPPQKYKQVKSGEKTIDQKYYDQKTKTWKTTKKKVPVYKNVPVESGMAGLWNDLWGEFVLEKRKKRDKSGRTYYEYKPGLYRYYRENGQTKRRWVGSGMKTLVDTNKSGGWTYGGPDPLAFVTIQLCQHGTSPSMGQMQVAELHIEELFPEREDETAIIFEAGDEVEIDFADHLVTRNGLPILEHLDIGSSFFPVEPGTVQLLVNSADKNAEHEVSIIERYL